MNFYVIWLETSIILIWAHRIEPPPFVEQTWRLEAMVWWKVDDQAAKLVMRHDNVPWSPPLHPLACWERQYREEVSGWDEDCKAPPPSPPLRGNCSSSCHSRHSSAMLLPHRAGGPSQRPISEDDGSSLERVLRVLLLSDNSYHGVNIVDFLQH